MKKNVVVLLIVLLSLVGLGTAFRWQETTFNDNGHVVLMRTNRFTGETQVFDRTRGWTKPGIPGTTGNAELDRTVQDLLAH
jgi:hypothetical protein